VSNQNPPAESPWPVPVSTPPPRRPNHILHLILTFFTCGAWSVVWGVLIARYWGVKDYRNPAEKPGMEKRTSIAASIVVGIVITSVIGSALTPDKAVTVSSPADVTVTWSPEPTTDVSVAPDPVVTTTAAVVKAAPKSPTIAQREAIESAQSYVDMSGFSRDGLLRQLTSNYGEGFKKADAIYAVNHIKVNWNAEAVESARSYLELSGFSRAGLIQQLHSKDGEGFTLKQATYAAKAVGL
jgi:Host cell surface-exposed lipoprotein